MFAATHALLTPGVLVVPIAFIDCKGEKTTTALVTMPTHATGNKLMAAAYRDGFITAPSLPAGWTSLDASTGDNTNSMRIGYKTAASGAETSGTWTNSTDLAVASYSGVVSIGAVAVNSGLTDPVVIPGLTLQNTDGTSWVFCGAGQKSGANSLASPPAGITYRGGYEGTAADQDFAVYDTNGGVASFTSKNIAYATAAGWRTFAVELKVT